MSSKYESADLLIKLYELRRDPTMREARTWFARSFNPDTIDDVLSAQAGPNSAHFRMVTSYWDMAAAFVVHGAIDEAMFNEANGEHLVVMAKLEPFLEAYRQKMGNAAILGNLERLVMKPAGAPARLASIRERFRALAAAP